MTRASGRRPASGAKAAPAPGAPVAPFVTVRQLLHEGGSLLRLHLAAGRSGLDRQIRLARVQRPGLALTGFTDYLRYGRVQIVGGSEVSYLAKLTAASRRAILGRLAKADITCFVVTKGLAAPPELMTAAEHSGVPVLTSPLQSTEFIKQLSAFLDQRLAQRTLLHAVLLDVFGLGVLVVGESGIGKSECALELIDRGHRLVADDVVELMRTADALVGSSPDLTRNHMEIRGVGVLNIKDLYGVSSIGTPKRVEMVVGLERWEAGREYDRLGLRDEKFALLGLEVPLIRMPVAPGRNIALLVEVAARNQLLKYRGYDAARRLAEQVDALIGGGTPDAAGRAGPARGGRRRA